MTAPPEPHDLKDRLEEVRGLLLGGADADEVYARWFHGQTNDVVDWPTAAQYLTATLDPCRFESGWQVIDAAPQPIGGVVVACGERQLVVAPPNVAPCSPADVALQPGARVLVNPVTSAETDGFWHCWSAGWQAAAPAVITRLYCALDRAHARDAMEYVAAAAPPHDLWSMKVLVGSHRGGRRDGMVIYLAGGLEARHRWIDEVIAHITTWCRPPLPPAVRPLAPGVGWAPDPGNGLSFGQALAHAVSELAGIATDKSQFGAQALTAVNRLTSRGDARIEPVP